MLFSMFLNAAEVFANVARKMFQRMLEAMISGAIAAHKGTMATRVTGPCTGQHMVVTWIREPHAGLGIIVYGLLCTSACKGQTSCCYKGIVALACPAVWTVS